MSSTRGVSYLRVSTASQGRSGLGLDAQRTAVAEVARSRHLSLLTEFTEVESGKVNERPQLAQALLHARLTGSVLVIAKLDRLSRNAAFLLTLRDSGVRFIAADIPDANDLTIGVLAVVAQAEREAISRRTTEALAVVRRRLAEAGEYTSPRSGRTIQRLGNPNGSARMLAAGAGTAAAVAGARARADRYAADVAPIIESARSGGAATLHALAVALNERGILTSRGGRWHASSVRNVLARLDQQRCPSAGDDRPAVDERSQTMPSSRNCAGLGEGRPTPSDRVPARA